MTDEYTPTVEEVREFVMQPKGDSSLARAQAEAVGHWFDRMIAGVERAAAVKALDSVWDIVYDEERYAREPNYVMHSSEVFAAINEVRGYVIEARADRIEGEEQA